MTKEQKAKAYDEALERMRKLYPGLHGATKEDAEHYFPELKENEDERMMGVICLALTDVPEERFTTEGTSLSEVLAWMEKQKEQKPVTINQDEKEFLADEITAFLCNYDKEFDGEDPVPSEVAEHFYLLGKQAQEQKSAEWSDTDNTGWDEAFACVTRAEKAAKNEEELQNAVTAEKWLKEIKFKYYVHLAKQEWGEKEQTIIEGACNALEIHGHSKLASKLRSLCPQSKNEEPKHTEVWVEGRTIFEQDAKDYTENWMDSKIKRNNI